MQFLKTLFWVILAVVLVLFANANWHTEASPSGRVIVQLWGGFVAEMRLPVLVILAFLLGFLPTLILHRTRLWALQRRLETQAQAHVVSRPAPPARVVPAANAPDRQATDAKAWPAE
jgi:putative membrane protein